jgi:hypothetical protein
LLHPDESDLSNERWRSICEEFVAETGFAGEASISGEDPPRPSAGQQ